jgi:hypothetical protein
MSGFSQITLSRITAPVAPTQATLSAATSTAAVDALSGLTDGQARLVVFAVDARTRIAYGASGLAAASATTGIPLAADEKIALWMTKGVDSYYRAYSTAGGQLTVWVVG